MEQTTTKQATTKAPYIVPVVMMVEFKTERGYSASTEATLGGLLFGSVSNQDVNDVYAGEQMSSGTYDGYFGDGF